MARIIVRMNRFAACCLAVVAVPLAAAPIENPDKDFPQRVVYESPDDATQIGRIEGRHDGRERRVDYPMKRIACPGGAR